MVIQPALFYFVEIDGVGLAQNGELLLGHFARNADGEPGAGEGMAVDEG